MNIVSTILLVVIILSPLGPSLGEQIAFFFIVVWVVSVLIDGLLTRMQRQPPRKTWPIAAIANTGSVAFQVLLLLVRGL
jgi:hypothetical protein